jgi:hypothetical protein
MKKSSVTLSKIDFIKAEYGLKSELPDIFYWTSLIRNLNEFV